MDSQLQSISKIFTDKLFRIPDYQRGYAWEEKQLKDFWNDIVQLELGHNHYVGVLTLEKVPMSVYKHWEDDFWIIDSKSFEPFYVVDGQQRLTTTIILIQAITESLPSENAKLNYTSITDIRKRFIFDSKNEGISRSYIFGYEKDNPSYEFLKTKVFNEESTSDNQQVTVYTHNLENAKKYFKDRLHNLTISEVEIVYKKITQHLLFNLYSISSDIDVFIAFETMNNRGKPLSHLELLKNRLIFLSTRFDVVDFEKAQLRKRVNDCWKAIYHNLGKNKENPLEDDDFLLNHFIMYFGAEFKQLREERMYFDSYHQLKRRHVVYRNFYIDYLLEYRFTAKNLVEGNTLLDKEKIEHKFKLERLTVKVVNEYVESLQSSVVVWYDLFNPFQSLKFGEEEKIWIDKLKRLSYRELTPILLTLYTNSSKKVSKEIKIKFLKTLERYVFMSNLSRYRMIHPKIIDFSQIAHELSNGKTSIGDVIKKVEESNEVLLSSKEFYDFTSSCFKTDGYYDWNGIRYFMYEYELFLKESSKQGRTKIIWEEMIDERGDFITIEHIYPQTAKKDCWVEKFDTFTPKEKKMLKNTLGNLLPLSRSKNSSLQNSCFKNKVDNGENQIGFRYGCLSENEVAKNEDWTAKHILERGIKLLGFMETRWGLRFGDRADKILFLGLSFVEIKQKK